MSQKKYIFIIINEQKNIKRRVYDALNVFEALGLIKKDKKKIIWKGFDESETCEILKAKVEKKRRILDDKQKQFQTLLYQYITLNNLIKQNKEKNVNIDQNESVNCPFIIINYGNGYKDNGPQINMDPSGKDVSIKFTDSFEILLDFGIIEDLGYKSISYEDLCRLLPPDYLHFLPEEYINECKMNNPTI